MSIEAMKQAPEALEKNHYYMIDAGLPNQSMLNENFEAITALRTAIEQAEKQEPVGQILVASDGRIVDAVRKPSKLAPGFHDVYTTPPAAQRQWVGLSEEEIEKLKHLIDWTATWSHGRFAYEIEQLLKEKNA